MAVVAGAQGGGMNLRSTDYLLTRFAHAMPGAMKLLGDIETDILGYRLAAIPIDRPVFITGLARSGTTLLLNLLAELPGVATHRYSDFPFLFAPVAWNRLQDRMAKDEPPVERPHRDRIRITKDSPEAFEEPIWSHFFAASHDPRALHRLTASDRRPRFDAFFRQHLRKVLLLRGGKRYVSKGNYNVTRIEYLADMLPNARFVIPVRNPVAQVESLMRQHRLFSEYDAQDPRVARYLEAAGHYEFGPQRVPVVIDLEDARRIARAWSKGDDALGYAAMWRSVYAHVHALRQRNPRLAARMAFLRYEDLCRDPAAELGAIARFCELKGDIDALLRSAPAVSPRGPDPYRLSREQRARVWEETAAAAQLFGYEPGSPGA
jgi:Sulfotransferase family